MDWVALLLEAHFHSLVVLQAPGLLQEVQVVAVARIAHYQLRLVLQMCPFLGERNLATVTHALFIPRLDCCNVLYVGLHHMGPKLQQMRSALVYTLTETNRIDHVTPILQVTIASSSFPPQFKVLVMMNK